jgi:hypothetical protein
MYCTVSFFGNVGMWSRNGDAFPLGHHSWWFFTDLACFHHACPGALVAMVYRACLCGC